MKKINIIKQGAQKKANPDYFIGPVQMKEFSNMLQSKEQKIFYVSFKNGAKTKVHFHEGGQILFVTKGKGNLTLYKKIGKGNSQFKIKKIKENTLNEGDMAYIPAKKLHTHGSINKNKLFSHIAINAYPAKNKEPKTIWYESDFKTKVTKKL